MYLTTVQEYNKSITSSFAYTLFIRSFFCISGRFRIYIETLNNNLLRFSSCLLLLKYRSYKPLIYYHQPQYYRFVIVAIKKKNTKPYRIRLITKHTNLLKANGSCSTFRIARVC